MSYILAFKFSSPFGLLMLLGLQGLTIVKPLIYGNVARYFGKKREEDGHTHEWTLYVKPYNNEDMSNYVKKVRDYKIHDIFSRVIIIIIVILIIPIVIIPVIIITIGIGLIIVITMFVVMCHHHNHHHHPKGFSVAVDFPPD